MNGGSHENRLDQPDCVGRTGSADRHVLAVDIGAGAVMTDRNKDGDYPAFPITAGNQVYAQGMSLRDWFAGQALAWAGNNEWFHSSDKSMAERAYKLADAMMEARSAKK